MTGQDRFHHGKPANKANYDSLLAAATPLAESSEGQAVMAGCISKYGGEEKLGKLKDFELTYEAFSEFSRDKYTLVRSFQRGRRHLIDRRGERRILNGNSCWYQGKGTQMDLDSGRYVAELYSYLTMAMPLAMHSEPFDQIRFGRRPDDPLAYIYLAKQDSMIMILGIDPVEHLIKTSEGIILQNNQKFVFLNKFSDHQQHEGYFFPGQIRTVSMGMEVLRAKLVGVIVNPGFGKEKFKPSKLAQPENEESKDVKMREQTKLNAPGMREVPPEIQLLKIAESAAAAI